jgi:hypothetical protein
MADFYPKFTNIDGRAEFERILPATSGLPRPAARSSSDG